VGPEGPRLEARRAESGSGVLGDGGRQPAPSPLARRSRERLNLPQRGPGRSSGRQRVFPHFKHSG